MKKGIIVFWVGILSMFFISISANAQADADDSKYVPKVVATDDFGYKMVFDAELAKACRKMSLEAYGIDGDDYGDEDNGGEYAKQLEDEGFVDIQQRDANDIFGVTKGKFMAGAKTFEINGKQKHTIAVVFRGTHVFADLITDVMFWSGENGFHSGFYTAASNAFDALSGMKFDSLLNDDGSAMTFADYIKTARAEPEKYSIVVTGHSLGGALANVFAAELIPEDLRSNVMCYTFASPIVFQNGKSREREEYNIFNIINKYDPIPYMGVDVINGRRFGENFTVEVEDSENWAHSSNDTYRIATEIVEDNIEKLYDMAYRKKYTIIDDNVEVTKDELHILKPAALEKGLFSCELGNTDLITHEDTVIKTDITTNGDFILENAGMRQRIVDIQSGDIKIGGDLRMGDTHLEIGDAAVFVDGDFNNLSSVAMKSDKGCLKINGDFIAASEWSGRFEATAGTLEVKGDIVNATGYSASGTHKLILSGDDPQKIDMEYDGRLSVGRINNLEITNTSEEGVDFVEYADVIGELYLKEGSGVVNSANIFLTKNAGIRGVWNGDLSASEWNLNKTSVINGSLYISDCISKESVINGNLTVSDELTILNNATLKVTKGTIETENCLTQWGGQLLFTNRAKMNVNGSFEMKGTLNVGSAEVIIFGDFNKSGNCVMENDEGYLLVHGDLNNESSTFKATAGVLEVKGNINDFNTLRASGTHKLILSGTEKQKIDAGNGRPDWDVGEVNNLEITNTSEAGVEFTDYLIVLSDIFQPAGTEIKGREYVILQNRAAFTDCGKINEIINVYNGNAENVIPTWLDFERYNSFGVGGYKALTINEKVNSESFGCDLYFGRDYDKPSAVVIVSFYDGDNNLIGTASKPVEAVSGKVNVIMDYENKPYTSCKIMVWESLGSLTPLMAAK